MHLQRMTLALTCSLLLYGCSKSENERTREPGEPAAMAAAKEAPAKPVNDASGKAIITVTSQSADLGAQGLLTATQPGWHSAQPVAYPQSIMVDFQTPKNMSFLGLLQQEGQPARAPKSLRVEVSEDGKVWAAVAGSDNACKPNMPDGWSNIDFSKSVTSRYLKVTIFSNCGDPQLLTLRGLRVD